ncbi:MAG TPA: FtsX-like permease family protein, partial [Spirochaetota bacterium]|nr:FtsX-like permease family protein [Spirochaetota bacterium]
MWFLALRHIFSRKSQTLLTFLAIVLGSGGYVVFSGIQLGFQDYMIKRLIERSGHINISTRDDFITAETLKDIFYKGENVHWINTPSGRRSYDSLTSPNVWYRKLKSSPNVIGYAPMISKEAIASRGGFTQTVNFIGIDPELQVSVTNLADDVTYGDLNSLNNGTSLIFAGERLLQILGVKINDTINISTSDGIVTPMKIIGTFNSGDRRSDERNIYASLITVQKATSSPGEVTSIIVKIKEFSRAAEIATEWSTLSRDRVESWDQLNSDHLSMMSTQDIVRLVTTSAFIVIVAFGIYNILNMVVNHKKRDIAILRSIGYDEKDTSFLFLIQGVLIGLAGGLAGLLLGFAACQYIETIKLPMGRQHMMISWDIMIYIKAFLLVFGASIIASFFPARAAGRLSPIEIIRGAD